MRKFFGLLHQVISWMAIGLIIGAIIEVFRAGITDSGVAMSLLLIAVLAQGYQINKLKESLEDHVK